KPRERVEIALRHEEPDRCPMQISFTPEFAVRLRKDMELRGEGVHNPHVGVHNPHVGVHDPHV
ncbi:MAG: hypothetical protein GWN58_67275, partial [Anaerolineae bacterium]|nr:hypothetical protein [Anaerolineae bacterium]